MAEIVVRIDPVTILEPVVMRYPLPPDWAHMTPGERSDYITNCEEATLLHCGPRTSADVVE